MKKSLFKISQMDCPSEERMIRLALAKYPGAKLQFDLDQRTMTAFHAEETSAIAKDLEQLNLGSRLVEESEIDEDDAILPPESEGEAKVLKILLLINFVMFVVEVGIGFAADSTGLIADSFDMLADAIVYGLSLYAVGKALSLQYRAAHLSGWFQGALAAFSLYQVIFRFFRGSEPTSSLMIGISLVALAANLACLYLLKKHRHGAVHMKASWIFSTNDVLANLGVIIAGVLVAIFKSPVPDLVIGLVITGLVAKGAFSILKLSAAK